jgi:hypothetical protein
MISVPREEVEMRGYRGGKDTTSDYLRIDVRYLHREGLLEPGRHFTLRWTRNDIERGTIQGRAEHNFIVLSYKHCRPGSDEWAAEQSPVAIIRSRCNYGGLRPWFLCPARGCGRRVAILYGGGIFVCRHCLRLAYETQRDQPFERALSRAQAIRMKLGGSGSMADPFPDKPKGMHWRIYERLREEHDRASEFSFRGMAQFLDRRRARV